MKSADLVLQGGVTSALVYIGLIRRLSRRYHFKGLGGASSGAVAAAAAAIAEHTRQQPADLPPAPASHPGFDPFQHLSGFPRRLAALDGQGQTMLFGLFQPQPATARAWRVVSAGLRGAAHSWAAALIGALGAAVLAYPLPALLGLAAGALPAFWFFAHLGGPLDGRALLGLALALAAGLLLGLIGLLAAVVWASWRGLQANHFGFCSGMGATFAQAAPDPLRPSLSWAFHALFNELAMRQPQEAPITFGALWGDDAAQREIDLQVITTSLSLQRPLRLPGDPGANPLQGFFYDPTEWREFFPRPVLAWLIARQRRFGGPPVTNAAGTVLLALPEPRDWPVLLAARLSLSFPLLLSAVPMYTLDGARDRIESGSEGAGSPATPTRFVARRVYFSDGGITNNCPVQLFDAPLPRRPTFVVKLARLPQGYARRWRVWLHGDPGAPPPRVKPLKGLVGLVKAIVGTLMNWRDQVQIDLPGYRERVATVGLKDTEGGLNLAMPPATIQRLVALGGRAGWRLDRAFNVPRSAGQATGWEQHRWVRLRSTLAAAQRYVGEIAGSRPEAVEDARDIDPTYAELLARRPPLSPPFVDAAAVAEAEALLAACQRLVDAGTPPPDLGKNAPQPAPRLRMSSPW